LKFSASPVLCRWSKLTPRFVDVKKCDRLTLLGRILFVWSHLCCLVSLLAGVQRDHRRNASRLTSRFWWRFDLITKHVGIHLSNLDFCVYLISGSEACPRGDVREGFLEYASSNYNYHRRGQALQLGLSLSMHAASSARSKNDGTLGSGVPNNSICDGSKEAGGGDE